MTESPNEILEDPNRPPDDVERYLLEDYFETVLPGFPPFEHVDRKATVLFEDSFGARGTIPGTGLMAITHEHRKDSHDPKRSLRF